MKRIYALALALLLTAASAWAEESAGTLRLGGLSLSHVTDKGERSVSFGNISLFFAMGTPNGTPTLQATFDNGEGQVVDGVLQIEGSSVLLSMGGISGIYALDLSRFDADGISGELAARAVGGALTMAGVNLGMLMNALPRDDGGARLLEINLPAGLLAGAAERLLAVGEGMESIDGLDLDALRGRLKALEGEAVLSFRYDESSGAFALGIAWGGEAVRLSGTLEAGHEAMIFAENSPEEERYDIMELEASTLEQLRGELNMIGIKLMHFADGSGLGDIL